MQNTLEELPDELSSSAATWRTVGAIAGVAISIGAIAFAYLLLVTTPSPNATKVAHDGLGFGGTLLGIAWFGGVKRGHGGFGAIAGSFALPVAILYGMHAGLDDLALARVNGEVILACFAWFAIGHALVRGTPAARGGAIIAGLSFVLLFIATAARFDLGGTGQMLSVLAFGAMAFVGVALAFEMPGLKTSRWAL